MKRLLISLLPVPAVALVLWAGGYNFDTRNAFTGYMTLVVIVVCCAVYNTWTE